MPQDDFETASNVETENRNEAGEDAQSNDAQPNDISHEPIAAETHAGQDTTDPADPDLELAKEAWEGASGDDAPMAGQLAEPFVGRWNKLISTTNWEKGRIISQWRQTLIDSCVDASQYSDEAWARRVGGVTAPHVGRLRRVYDRFGDEYETYDGLYWSHFLAALDWQDAPMWLEGASKEGWSISAMREKRWQAEGAVESQRPTDSQIVEVDVDEDVTVPAQGGGNNRDYDNSEGSATSGPTFEGPDFGDEEALQSLGGSEGDPSGGHESSGQADEPTQEAPVQPFIGLPALPDDLSDALETLKLSLLRHKSAGWRDVSVDTVQKYLDAVGVMIRS